MFEPAGLLDGLNEDQCQAVTHQSGPLLVLAGAGTGKTRTLVARATWLRAQGVPASRILLLTFTRRAADDMLARVTPAGAAAADRVCGGTFHAVAHQIIRAHAESFSLPPAFSVIDPPDVTDLMDADRAEHGLVGTQRRAPRAATCADIYTRCVNTHATVKQVTNATSSSAEVVLAFKSGQYDLLLADTSDTGQAHAADVLQPLDFSKIPNIAGVTKSFRTAYPYGIPTDYGKVGIGYRPDIVGEEITSWHDVWRLAPKFSGQVVFIDLERDCMGSTLKYLGYSSNSTSPAQLNA